MFLFYSLRCSPSKTLERRPLPTLNGSSRSNPRRILRKSVGTLKISVTLLTLFPRLARRHSPPTAMWCEVASVLEVKPPWLRLNSANQMLTGVLLLLNWHLLWTVRKNYVVSRTVCCVEESPNISCSRACLCVRENVLFRIYDYTLRCN